MPKASKVKAEPMLTQRQTSKERHTTLSDVKFKYYDTVEDSRRMEQQAKELRYHTQGLVRSARRRSLSSKSAKRSFSRNRLSATDIENRGIFLNQRSQSPSNKDLIQSPRCPLRSRNETFIN